jgi:hypothetical protein
VTVRCVLRGRYVERRLLEEHLAGLSSQLAQRDALDGELQEVLGGALARLQAAEEDNVALRAALAAAGRGS